MTTMQRSVSFESDRHGHLLAWWDAQENASLAVRTIIDQHLTRQFLTVDMIREVVEDALDQRLAYMTYQPPSVEEALADDFADPLDDFGDLLD